MTASGPVARSRSGPGGGGGGGGAAAMICWAAATTASEPCGRPKGTASLTLLLLYEMSTLASAAGPACESDAQRGRRLRNRALVPAKQRGGCTAAQAWMVGDFAVPLEGWP